MIRTVLGDRELPDGPILAHEHLQIDLSHNKGPDNVFAAEEEPDVTADLKYTAKTYGLVGLADLSPVGGGRNVAALARISRATGVAVVASTGYYWEPVPKIVSESSEDELVEIMARDVEQGAEGSDHRCGIIKIGTLEDNFSAATEKLFRAAARTSTRTGAPVITHTEKPYHALWHVEALQSGGMDMRHALISHLHKASSIEDIAKVAATGAFVGVDQIGFARGMTMSEMAEVTKKCIDASLIGQLIISSDVARKSRFMKNGGTSYATVFAKFLGLLRERGVTEAQIHTLLHVNPRSILSLKHSGSKASAPH
jgi:predicted metal-dependent phosphotriesterase family hydrolase